MCPTEKGIPGDFCFCCLFSFRERKLGPERESDLIQLTEVSRGRLDLSKSLLSQACWSGFF